MTLQAPLTAVPLLRFEEGDDHRVDDDKRLPFRLLETLGTGHCGVVEKVENVNTGRVFARKKVWLGRQQKRKDETKRIFDNEMTIIRGLEKHHHIISVFATYMTKHEVGLILQPVADEGDLERFLDHVVEMRPGDPHNPQLLRRLNILDSAFGCLASGLAFMNRKNTRHKDIKPQNILVHDGSVLYTDFGYSQDYSNYTNSTTEGIPYALTRRYSAPEVLSYEKRNSSADVFSLGCVFVEILSVLENVPHLAPESESFSASLESIEKSLSSLVSTSFGASPADVIGLMIAHDQTVRPRAQDVADYIFPTRIPEWGCNKCYKSWKQHGSEARKLIAGGTTAGGLVEGAMLSPGPGVDIKVKSSRRYQLWKLSLLQRVSSRSGTIPRPPVFPLVSTSDALEDISLAPPEIDLSGFHHRGGNGPSFDIEESKKYFVRGRVFDTPGCVPGRIYRYIVIRRYKQIFMVCSITAGCLETKHTPPCDSYGHLILHVQSTKSAHQLGECGCEDLSTSPFRSIELSDISRPLGLKSLICLRRIRRMPYDLVVKSVGLAMSTGLASLFRA